MDISKLSPAPWEFFAGSLIADNAYDMEWIANSCDPSYPRETRYADGKFMALARNAFDVMMRRGWTARRMPKTTRHPNGQWYASFYSKGFDTILAREECGYRHYHDDPFTALIEADKWYQKNVESKNATEVLDCGCEMTKGWRCPVHGSP